jgi:hypothetical protein
MSAWMRAGLQIFFGGGGGEWVYKVALGLDPTRERISRKVIKFYPKIFTKFHLMSQKFDLKIGVQLNGSIHPRSFFSNRRDV